MRRTLLHDRSGFMRGHGFLHRDRLDVLARRLLPVWTAIIVASFVLPGVAFAERRATVDAEGLGSPVFVSMTTHLRYAHPSVNLRVGGEGGANADYKILGEGRPGVEATYGGFGVSASGDFLRNPTDNLFRGSLLPQGGTQDFRARYYAASWGVETHHLTAKGAIQSGDRDTRSVAHQYPDIHLRAAGLTVYRSFDPESRVYRLSEGLSESGGHVGVFLTAGVSHASVEGDDVLLPGVSDRDSRFYRVTRASVTSASVGGGYAINSNMLGLYFDQSLFAAYGPQYRTWGERSDVAFNLAKMNLRVALGIRNRWFDVGVGVENEAYASWASSDRMVVSALAMQAKMSVFL